MGSADSCPPFSTVALCAELVDCSCSACEGLPFHSAAQYPDLEAHHAFRRNEGVAVGGRLIC